MTTKTDNTAINIKAKTAKEAKKGNELITYKKPRRIPRFKDEIVKNPNKNALFPINWEEKVEEDRYWIEYEPTVDEYGNCTTVKNEYVVFKRLVGFYTLKSPKENRGKPLFELKNYREEEEDEKLL